MTTNTQCNCGKTKVSFSGEPLFRVHCHCSICQSVYQQPFADFVVLSTKQIQSPVDPAIQFKKHRSPPAVNRGLCPHCKKPVLAKLSLGPGIGMAFIPAANFPNSTKLPAAAFHTFYDRRVADIDDHTPKINGYWPSQLAVTKLALSSILGLKRPPSL